MHDSAVSRTVCLVMNRVIAAIQQTRIDKASSRHRKNIGQIAGESNFSEKIFQKVVFL